MREEVKVDGDENFEKDKLLLEFLLYLRIEEC